MIGVTYNGDEALLIVPPPPGKGYPYNLPVGHEVLNPPDWVIEVAMDREDCTVRDVD